MATLERICLNEVSKCVDAHLYNDALKNPSLIIASKALSDFLGITCPVTLLFVKKAQRTGMFDELSRGELLLMLTIEFNHLVDHDDDINYLLILLTGLTNGDGYDSDYSASPIL